MSFVDLSHVTFYEKERFESFFEGVGEKIDALYEKAKKGAMQSQHWQAQVMDIDDTLKGIHISSEETEFLFVFEKFGFSWIFSKCFRVFPNWKEDPLQVDPKDFILQSDYFNRYTDNVLEIKEQGVDKPNLAFYLQHADQLLEERFKPDCCLFSNQMTSNAVKQLLAKLALKVDKMTNIYTDGFFYHVKDIVLALDAIHELLEVQEETYREKVISLVQQVKDPLNEQFFSLSYAVNRMIKECKRKKAKNKETAIEGKYPVAWHIKTKDKHEGVFIRMHNSNTYAFAFLVKNNIVTCYEVFNDWTEETLDTSPQQLVELLQFYYCYDTDFTEKKPSLSYFLDNRARCTPVFSYDIEQREMEFDPYDIHRASRATDLLAWFE